MSHSTSLVPGPTLHLVQPRAGFIAGIVIAASAAAVVSSLVTAAWLSAGPAAAQDHRSVAAAAAPPVADLSPGTGVPDASRVFAGHDSPVEEPAPTF